MEPEPEFADVDPEAVEPEEDPSSGPPSLDEYLVKGAPSIMLAPHEVEKVTPAYPCAPKGAWVISGPLWPGSYFRTTTDRLHQTAAEARADLEARGYRVYDDESKPGFGFWAFRVTR